MDGFDVLHITSTWFDYFRQRLRCPHCSLGSLQCSKPEFSCSWVAWIGALHVAFLGGGSMGAGAYE